MGKAQTQVAPFVLRSVIDGRVTIDEQLWDREQLRLRMVEVLPVPGYQVFWGVAATKTVVGVERQDGMTLSSWTCPSCEESDYCWDLKPTPEMVLGRLSAHRCSEGSVTVLSGDGTVSVPEQQAVTEMYRDKAAALESRELAPQAMEAGGFWAGVEELPRVLELEEVGSSGC